MIDFENNDYDYDEDDFDEWHLVAVRLILSSRKEHKCVTCRQPIRKGGTYMKVCMTDGRKKKMECQCFACSAE